MTEKKTDTAPAPGNRSGAGTASVLRFLLDDLRLKEAQQAAARRLEIPRTGPRLAIG